MSDLKAVWVETNPKRGGPDWEPDTSKIILVNLFTGATLSPVGEELTTLEIGKVNRLIYRPFEKIRAALQERGQVLNLDPPPFIPR